MPDFSKLPPDIKNRPEVMWLAIDKNTADIAKLSMTHHDPHHTAHLLEIVSRLAAHEVRTPFGNLPLGVAAFVGALYWWQPALVTGLIKSAWPL